MTSLHPLVDQDSPNPTRKLTAATIGSALAIVIIGGAVWLFDASQPPAGFEAGLGTVLALAFGYFVRDRETNAARSAENLAHAMSDLDADLDEHEGSPEHGEINNQLVTIILVILVVIVLIKLL